MFCKCLPRQGTLPSDHKHPQLSWTPMNYCKPNLAEYVSVSRGGHLALAWFKCSSPGRWHLRAASQTCASPTAAQQSHSVVSGQNLVWSADHVAKHHRTPTLPSPVPSCSKTLWGVIATYHFRKSHPPSSQRHEIWLLGLFTYEDFNIQPIETEETPIHWSYNLQRFLLAPYFCDYCPMPAVRMVLWCWPLFPSS